MSEDTHSWLRSNGPILITVVLQAVLIIIWGARLDNRVDMIETRGTPLLTTIDRRLTTVEAKQSLAVDFLRENSAKMDRLMEELRKPPPR